MLAGFKPTWLRSERPVRSLSSESRAALELRTKVNLDSTESEGLPARRKLVIVCSTVCNSLRGHSFPFMVMLLSHKKEPLT